MDLSTERTASTGIVKSEARGAPAGRFERVSRKGIGLAGWSFSD